MSSPRILLIEDDAVLARTLASVLRDDEYDVRVVARGDDGVREGLEQVFDAVLTDLRLPGKGGLEVISELHAHAPRLPIILMTAHGTTETAIEAMKLGAFDYLLKPFEMPELLDLLQKAVADNRNAAESLAQNAAPQSIVGRSKAMQDVYKQLGRVAATPVSVLVRGETGTGKELVAKALHQHSARAKEPFIAVNCAAIPEALLESELFGHEKGAFTGADARRIGRFEQAHRGTIFLDEIGDMSPGTQAKLLRVLQGKTIQRIGSKETIPVDVRVVAATHRDLEEGITEKTFREDLYYRLSGVTLHLPPLRHRPEDIPLLIDHILRSAGETLAIANPRIQPEAVDLLSRQPWPGNVRQLENVVRQSLIMARHSAITAAHVQAALTPSDNVETAPSSQSMAAFVTALLQEASTGACEDAHARAIHAVERELIGQAIQLSQGNQAKAARWLGITRYTLREKLLFYGLFPDTGTAAAVPSASVPGGEI
ncbi:MAG: sigma-54-dependent transcriptional regulator [Candidatus Methylacidiphilales bacterium]|nr:sigma-54 dependent transcriptional regulator [Candidatus Methylacidiphilales bacterium]